MARSAEASVVRGIRFPLRDWTRMQRALKRRNAAENLDMSEADFIRFAIRELCDKVLDETPTALAS